VPEPHRWPHPAYSIRTPRLVLRCYERSDVDAVHEAVIEHADDLRPWMPWVQNEPVERSDRVEMVRRFRGHFDLGIEFVYGIFDRRGGDYLGGCGLHPRTGHRTLEIGYWIAPPRWGQGLATEVAAALTRVAFEVLGADRVEIRIDPDNDRSLAVARKLGYREEGTLRGVGDPAVDGLPADHVVFGMLRGELAGSRAEGVDIHTEPF